MEELVSSHSGEMNVPVGMSPVVIRNSRDDFKDSRCGDQGG